MKLTAEYGTYPDSARAKASVHVEMYSPRVKTVVRLIQSTAGYEPAGSAARWTNGYWAVRWEKFGAFQGARYRTEHEARAHLSRLA